MTASSTTRSTRRALIRGLALAVLLTSLALVSPADGARVRGDFFGMHDWRVGNGFVPTVNLGSIRLWATGVHWRQIETAPGDYDWSRVETAVRTARREGLRPMLVLGQTPRFWAKDPTASGDGSTSMPRIAPWKRYVRKAARRYGNTVDYQIWNEPNVANFWTGSVRQMARLTATGSRAIKKVVPRATVVAPSFALRLPSQQKWFRRYWAARVDRKGMAGYVKVVAVHLYPLPDQGPEASMRLLRFAKRALPKAARSKPMWNTEVNYGVGDTAHAEDISEAKQAAFVARTLVLNAARSIRRVYWFSWGIGPVANTHLARSDGTTLTRAGRAWQVTHGWLVGTNVKGCTKTSRGRLEGLYTCKARASRREVRRYYWKPSGESVRITSRHRRITWTDLSGTTHQSRYVRVGRSPIMVSSRR